MCFVTVFLYLRREMEILVKRSRIRIVSGLVRTSAVPIILGIVELSVHFQVDACANKLNIIQLQASACSAC
jgi:hypothetical protein